MTFRPKTVHHIIRGDEYLDRGGNFYSSRFIKPVKLLSLLEPAANLGLRVVNAWCHVQTTGGDTGIERSDLICFDSPTLFILDLMEKKTGDNKLI